MPKVETHLVGDAWSTAEPGADPVLYGSVTLEPSGAFEARSLQSFRLTYTAGRFGLDDTGAIKVVHRYSNDWGRLQTEDPTAVNYVTATASNGSRLQLVYAHVGGRYADITQVHDPRLETAMEIHSAWGTFEWLLTDGFALGHRSGVVCNSDGHKGRPGASYPGAASFGAYGGLTCFYAEELSRDGFFECLRRRHHYGTTGCRLHLDVGARFAGGGTLFKRDPRYWIVAGEPVGEAMMGDIVQTDDAEVTLAIECIAQAPIERIEVLNGTRCVATLRGFGAEDLGQRIRVIWQGAEYRGRGRQTTWKGEARLEGGAFRDLRAINAWNHERPTRLHGPDRVTFDTLTTGNFGGFDAWIDESAESVLAIETAHVTAEVRLVDLALDERAFEAGGLERRLRVFRLPEVNDCLELTREINVSLEASGDNPLWVRVTTEDGFNAWSSPIFVYRHHPNPLFAETATP